MSYDVKKRDVSWSAIVKRNSKDKNLECPERQTGF